MNKGARLHRQLANLAEIVGAVSIDVEWEQIVPSQVRDALLAHRYFDPTSPSDDKVLAWLTHHADRRWCAKLFAEFAQRVFNLPHVSPSSVKTGLSANDMYPERAPPSVPLPPPSPSPVADEVRGLHKRVIETEIRLEKVDTAAGKIALDLHDVLEYLTRTNPLWRDLCPR
jgi:hypothetical protein